MKRPAKTMVLMWCFIASEATFFGFLILAYIYYQAAVSSGPDARHALDPAVTGIYTVCLLASSGTLVAAERGLRNSKPGRFKLWMAVTIMLGLAFISGQTSEYLRLLAHNITTGRNVFGAAFFTVTGFHGFHVCCGIAALGTLPGIAVKGARGTRETAALGAVSLYWHFVDAVWIVIFSVIYLAAFL